MSDQDDLHAAHWDAVVEATERLREGDHQGAIDELRAVLDRDPSNPYAYYFLGAAYFELGAFEEARQAYERALQYAPKYLGALIGLGHCLRMLDRLDEAIRVGERALAMGNEPRGDSDAHYLLGLTYAARGDTGKAIEHLEAFQASNPEVEVRFEVDAMLQVLKGKARPLEPV